ncbi:MAG: AMP-binding protein, partial [Deltaproteobacteria bacterium]|nr:AMP-binding protein [Deltaproteobacteria bacterium]
PANLSGSEGLSFRDWIQSFPQHDPPEFEMDDDHPLSIMFTSGTTGPSKGVLNGQNAYIRCGSDCAKLLGLTAEDRCYVVLPLYHGNPQMMAVMTALWIGGSIVISERFSASRFLDEARRYGVTYCTYVGTILTTLCKQPPKPDDREHSLRLGFGGGASQDVWQTMENRFGIRVYEAYGMIEAGCVTSVNRPHDYRFGSMGIPRDCLEVRIADEQDEELPRGTSGEIQVRPREPFVMFDGYYGLPEITLAAYRNLWFHTGDRGRMDKDGFVYFEGRLKNTIRRKGENISPEAIENILNAHPQVLESAVVGVPDEVAGEEIKAYIVLPPGESLSPEELVAWCQEGLPDFMIPRYIEFRKEFPKTGSEKIQKYKLAQEPGGLTWERMKK